MAQTRRYSKPAEDEGGSAARPIGIESSAPGRFAGPFALVLAFCLCLSGPWYCATVGAVV